MKDLNEQLNDLGAQTSIPNVDDILDSEISIDNIIESNSVEYDYINLDIPDEDSDLIQVALMETEDGTVAVGAEVNPEFVKQYLQLNALISRLSDQLSDAKSRIKAVMEANDLGTFTSNGARFKYSKATTTTSIDAVKLKQKYATIAAECSRVSARNSSLTIEEYHND